MASCLLRILGHQALELRLGLLVFEVRIPAADKDAREFGPGIGGAHIDNANRLDSRLWRVDTEKGRGLAAFDTTPELPLGGDDEMLIQGVSERRDLYPLATTGNDREHRRSCCNHPHIVLQLRHMLRGSAFFRE